MSGRNRAPFPGFQRPTYTQVPDEFFHLAPELLERHLKILLYVMRRTFGFRKDRDRISISQFLEGITTRDGRRLDRGCGLSKPSLLQGLRELREAGYLIATRAKGPDGGDSVTEYQLNLAPERAQSAGNLTSFKSFRAPKHVQVPDELFDVLLPDLNAGQLKVVLFICRRTFGYGINSTPLRRAEIVQGAGLSESKLKVAIKQLKEYGVVTVEERRSAERGSEASVYRLNVVSRQEDDEELEDGGSQSLPPRGLQSLPRRGSKNSPPGGSVYLPPGSAESLPRGGQETGRTGGAESLPDNTSETVEQETEQQHSAVTHAPASMDIVVALVSTGITRKTAEALARIFPAETILAQIDMLPYRHAENPPAMLVRAIQEDWAPPLGYGEGHEETALAPQPGSARPRADADSWRGHQLSEHGVDEETVRLWAQVCEWIPRFAGRFGIPDWLRGAVLLPPLDGHTDILLREMQHLLVARREYERAVEDALTTVLRRKVRVNFVYAP
ncbi:MAG: replication protein [Chloroflexota bacterium]|nr:replication protein [Chloroflexota bacterium]